MTTFIPEPAVERTDISPDLGATLTAALRRATERGRPVLAAYTVAARELSPPAVYRAGRNAGVSDLWYWEQPSSGYALVGIGTAASIEHDGPGAPARAASDWRALAAESGVAHPAGATVPVLSAFAGSAFDPARPCTALWDGFPSAALAVPRLLVRWEQGVASATIAALVHPGDALDEHVRRLESALTRLDAAPVHRLPATAVAAKSLTVGDGIRERRAFEALVTLARDRTRAGDLRKVVTARAVEVSATGAFEPVDILSGLRDTYPTASIYAVQRGAATFVGATPERLARVSRGRVETMALAGTAPRGLTPAEDAALASALQQSAKNREEHAVVVASIRDALAPLCEEVHIASAPRIRKLPNVQHLETPISATLAPGHDLLDVAAMLHPTPAVGGLPLNRAVEFIRHHEGLDRGWYAGSLGWVDARGDGELVVALRSALLRGDRGTLFAGCGIVPDSDAAAEYEESRLKLRAMLSALREESEGGAR